ncbi:hypothetical protein OGAPHI_002642 [Ogataea philodendri]|uniref:Structural maintenance of chromosomes protein n=1 Tax=Ogataea philodendri TaxID=1378263 RepID=A0A9P8PBP5_9ASCO|nr:uncharacterized protein OGAPHI_002642 [Ogataea philodendri]KAH3668887.1 hypothetical protein OGAPHI_002642 [Ogataea philodendri]
MGRLVGLELNNFKSYRGTASIGFGSSFFTSIIGPNGSGKSNMMDAISFVLGIRSSHLRSTNLKDLIYRGRILNDEAGGDEDKENDPTTAYVMAIYEKSNGDILKLKRSINETGASEYKINNKTVSATQYAEVLKKENILIKARNFLVFQGDVEKIASQSPDELTKLLETISGSIDYKKEYDMLMEEKDKAHDTSALLNSRKKTLREEFNQYKNQTLEIEQFDLKSQQLSDLIQTKYLTELYHNDQELKQSLDALKAANAESKELNKQLKDSEGSMKDVIKERTKKDNVYQKTEKSISKKAALVKEKHLALIPLQSEVAQVSKKIRDYKRRVGTLSEDRSRQQEIVETIGHQLSTIQKAYDNYIKEYEANTMDSISPEALEEYKKLRETFLMKGGHIESKLIDLEDDVSTLNLQIENAAHQKEIVGSRISELEAGKSQLNSKIQDNRVQLKDANSAVKYKKAELRHVRSVQNTLLQKEFDLNTVLKELLVQLNELQADQRESAREKRLRENCSSLKRLFPGVRGLVCDLCKPTQKKYELAVSTVLGKNFDAIVVDNLSVANKCVEYLKEQRSGVASFVPLDTVDSKPPQAYLRTIDERVRPTLDVVSFEPEIEKAVQYVCGNSIVCDNMDIAKYVKWERNVNVKVVTLEGSLIHKSGLMTGGLTQTGNRRWDKSEIQALNTKKEEIKASLEEIAKRKISGLLEKKLMDEVEVLEAQVPPLSDSGAELQRLVRDADSEIKNQKRVFSDLETELKGLNKKLKDAQSKVDVTANELSAVQQSVYASFCKKNGFSNIGEYEDSYGSRSRDYSKEKARYVKQIQYLENKLSFEKDRLEEQESRLDRLERDLSKFGKTQAKLASRKETLETEADTLESEHEVLKEELYVLNDNRKAQLIDYNQLEDGLSELRSSINDISKKIANLEDVVEKKEMEKINILRNCKLENVKLPLTLGSMDDIPLEDAEQSEEVLADGIEIDFEGLKDEYKTGELEELQLQLKQSIDQTTAELGAINPNMKARERLENVKVRLADLDADFSDAKQDEKKIVTDFQLVKSKRYKQFMDTFNHISAKIDGVYKELTKSKVSPLGGSAYLTLEDEDEPYLHGVKYHAMPPMKRFRDMELLSGGEKTIAALALLFTIHSHHPSPFFVLDEVDAALDNANVNKIANYIANNSGPDFQFIVISLKNGLFERSDALVGIYREQNLNTSKTLTLDLRTYPDQEAA